LRDELASVGAWALVVGLAVAMWLGSLSAILLLARFVPHIKFPMRLVAYLLYVGAVLSVSAPLPVSSAIHQILILTPAGSATYFLEQYVFYRNALALALVPLAAFVVLLPMVFRQLQATYTPSSLLDELFGKQEEWESEETESSYSANTPEGLPSPV